MMRLMKGNLWNYPVDLILVTTNSFIRADGRLVMGRGAALEAARKYAGIDRTFGKMIRQQVSPSEYGMLVDGERKYPAPWRYMPKPMVEQFAAQMLDRKMPVNADVEVGMFQVKYHWTQAARLDLIRMSAEGLGNWMTVNPGKTVSLNFPGIGNGRLTRDEVMPVLAGVLGGKKLLTVWER